VLTVAVLGEVEVRRDGELLPVPSGKTTDLLVRLALDAGTRVRADVLLDELWAAPTGRNTLQSKVSQLRRALGDPALVAAAGDGYALAVEPGCVDAYRVVDLAAGATAAWEHSDPSTALALASEGGALFTGGVLVGAGDWAAPHRVRLEEVRLGLLEVEMAARVELGSGGDVVGDLEALVRDQPMREALWASLITALYRAGRQADALATYSRVRTLLVEELGVEPGPELRTLERDVLRQSVTLGSRRRGSSTVPGNLPEAASTLVGRADDVAALASALDDHRLVTVVGTAGVGKTRLALEVAHSLTAPGGVWLVRLDEADLSADLSRVVAETLHVRGGEHALAERLSGAQTVLVLDNAEHLLDEVAALAGRLLAAAPRLRILATSQAALGIDTETVHRLEPLPMSEAVELFTSRVETARGHQSLDPDTAPVIEEVCRSLDGLPLALELAAARARSLSLEDIATRLDDRFTLLRDPGSHRPERSRALASAIAWSYRLLFPDDQRALWALSCFAGTATLGALEHVLVALGVPPATVLDTVGRLVDRSLVAVDLGGDGSLRYRLLDSIRAYASDRLQESGELPAAATAQAAWCAETADWCDAHIRGADQPRCLTIARAERANIDGALAWCARHDPVLGARTAIGFGWTWVVLGDGTAGAERIRGAVAGTVPDRERATALLLAGWLEASAGNVLLAQADLDSALALAEDLDDDLLIADTRRHQAFLAIQQGRPQEVLARAAASLSTYRSRALPWQTAGSLLLAAFGALMLGDTAAATRDATEARSLLVTLDDMWGRVHAEAMLGGIGQAEHRYDDATKALRSAAELSQQLGFVGQAALHLATLGRVQQRTRDIESASDSFERAIADAGASGDGRLQATARLDLARLHRSKGDHASAVRLLEVNQRWYAHAGGGEGALLNRCILAAETGDVAALHRALAQARGIANNEVAVLALDALAAVAAAAGDADVADGLLAESDALVPTVAHLVDDLDRHDRNRARALLHDAADRPGRVPGPEYVDAMARQSDGGR
jgi:predicted ATPase/DNA-binding SARP family transcriptional activator